MTKRPKPDASLLTLTVHSIGAFMGRSGIGSAEAATDEIRRLFGTAMWSGTQRYSPTRARRHLPKKGKKNSDRVDVYQTPHSPAQWVFYLRGLVLLTVHGPFRKQSAHDGSAAPARKERDESAIPAPRASEAIVVRCRCARCGRPVERTELRPGGRRLMVTCHGEQQQLELDARTRAWLERVELEAFGEATAAPGEACEGAVAARR